MASLATSGFCLPVFKAAKELGQLNTPFLNASDYKFQP